jgi:hypothetical protein
MNGRPPGERRVEAIHRFKGLERGVVVLVELRADDERLSKLLYIGASRARHHLIAILTPELARQVARGRLQAAMPGRVP